MFQHIRQDIRTLASCKATLSKLIYFEVVFMATRKVCIFCNAICFFSKSFCSASMRKVKLSKKMSEKFA